MGFPLSTDIFGQLKWLVKQVKLLAFRVTKLEIFGEGSDLQQVLNTGNSATDVNLIIAAGDGSSAITLDQTDIFGLAVTGDYDNTQTQIYPNNITLKSNGDETIATLTSNGFYLKPLVDAYPRTDIYNDQITVSNSLFSVGISQSLNGTSFPNINFYDKTKGYWQYIQFRTGGDHDTGTYDRRFGLPYNNRGVLTLATQEVCAAPLPNIDLSLGNFTPNLYNEIGSVYFNILVGSGTNSIVLNNTFTDYVTYTFFNESASAKFTTNTGGTIYGTSTGITAGLILVTRRGNDFFINR